MAWRHRQGRNVSTPSTERLTRFIREQKIYFVGTAPADGRINVSPKGMDSLRVLDDSTVAWLNVTGSGNVGMRLILWRLRK
ncbi:hypothetical protein [Thiothrix nivea]|uniref:hypothetical protein n=1 Tax=Thiothrix nivea TaxID=1031 RepID=UPI001B7FB88E|nr:hypothetical protein [Thiothrix nivea]